MRKSNEKKALKKELTEFTRPKYSPNDVNPDAKKYRRAAYAEENILAVLMQYPQYAKYVFEKLSGDDFLTSFNKDLYLKLQEILVAGKEFEISYLSESYDSKQLGRVMEINSKFSFSYDTEQVIDDCIKVIFDEKDKLGIISPSNMNDDDFLNALNKQAKDKKGKH